MNTPELPAQAPRMTDSEREEYIKDFGLLMASAYNRYEVSGCFAASGEADGWRLQMEAAIASRSPAQGGVG